MSVLIGSLTLRSPDRGNILRVVKRQAMRRTAGGQLYVYDKGIDTYELEWTFTELSQAERDSLQTMFDAVANGAYTTFEIRDWYGRWWDNCRFLDPSLEFSQTDEHRELGSGHGIYSVTLRLEATPRLPEPPGYGES